ncbi:GtrA family protein [Feifania hominis]|uniref:GtrA family protein n=1 Tax=Feifania hominis TaxID=2763660 RepID=A0A926DB61_9FIRM|nr:GtrA family protein [Feifania hominis]MBC8535283.1 GtrA family protein [Feifania hominis]
MCQKREFKLFGKTVSAEFLRQFVRYLIIGVSAVVVEYLLFLGMLTFLKGVTINLGFAAFDGEFLANSIAMILGAVYSFLLNRFWSFQSKAPVGMQMVKYAILFVFNLFASNFLLYCLSGLLVHLPVELAKVPVMGIIALWNFFMYRVFVYR